MQCLEILFQLLAKFISDSSTKGAMASAFRRAPYILSSISKISRKMQCLGILFQVLTKFISKTFPKQHFRSALRKEQRAAPFLEPLVLNLLSAKNQQKCNAQKFCFNYWQNLSVRLSQSSCFKALNERSNEQLLSQRTLYLIFYQQNIDKNAMLWNSVPSADKIHW